MGDVVGGQQLRQLGLYRLQLSELPDIGELGGVDRPVLVLVENQDVDDADRSGVDELEKLRRHLTGEVHRSGWELDHQVINRAEFVKGCVGHRSSILGGWAVSATGAPSRRAGAPRV